MQSVRKVGVIERIKKKGKNKFVIVKQLLKWRRKTVAMINAKCVHGGGDIAVSNQIIIMHLNSINVRLETGRA